VDTLTSPPVADVLARLFDEAQATDGPLEKRFAEVAADEKALAEFLAMEANDYKGMYQQLAGYYLNISPEFGHFLYVCARARQANRIVEFGTSFGVSTIYLATALRDVGDGVDLVLLDGAFTLYLPVLTLLESRLSPGALVIAENAVEQSGAYLNYVRDPDNGYRTIPLTFGAHRGNEMSVRTA
jgi:predicted O-methyltransferase YrrM